MDFRFVGMAISGDNFYRKEGYAVIPEKEEKKDEKITSDQKKKKKLLRKCDKKRLKILM